MSEEIKNEKTPQKRDSVKGWKNNANIVNLINEYSEKNGISVSFFNCMYDIEDSIFSSSDDFNNHLPSLSDMGGLHLYNIDNTLKLEYDKEDIPGIFDTFPKDYNAFTNISKNKVFSIFTIGVNHHIIGLIRTNGKIYLLKNAITLIWYCLKSRNRTEYFLDLCFKMMKCLLEKYNKNNENSSEVIKDLVASSIIKVIQNNNVIKNNQDTVEELLEKINENMSSLFPHTLKDIHYFYLRNQRNVYAKILESMFLKQDAKIKDSYKKGLSLGMKFFSILGDAGYTFDSKKEVWFKNVNIVPTMCYKNNKLWKILPKYQQYKIEKLIIDPNQFSEAGDKFHVKAVGEHPNLFRSGEDLCLGELDSKWSYLFSKFLEGANTLNDVYNFLLDIEETLEIINFDSSFRQMEVDFYDATVSATRDLSKLKKDRGVERRWKELN